MGLNERICIVLVLIGYCQAAGDLSEKRSREVQTIRRWVAAHQDAFNRRDVDYLLSGPAWHVTRYLDFVGNGTSSPVTEAVKLIDDNLKFKNSMNLSNLQAEDFPCEFWLTGFGHVTVDRDGQPILVVDMRTGGSYAGGLRDAWYAFGLFHLDQVDRLGRSWRILYSMANTGLANYADISGIVKTYVKHIEHYPYLLREILLNDMHPAIEVAVRMMMSMASRVAQDRVRIPQDRERFFVVKKRDMPELAGGRLPVGRSLMAVHFPAGLLEQRCVPIKKMASQRGWSTESVRQFLANTHHLIESNAHALKLKLRT